jgi:hypothetical protein
MDPRPRTADRHQIRIRSVTTSHPQRKTTPQKRFITERQCEWHGGGYPTAVAAVTADL